MEKTKADTTSAAKCKSMFKDCENPRGEKINLCEDCERIATTITDFLGSDQFEGNFRNGRKFYFGVIRNNADVQDTRNLIKTYLDEENIVIDDFFVFQNEDDRDKFFKETKNLELYS